MGSIVPSAPLVTNDSLPGLYKGRGQCGAQSYLLADRAIPWYIVLLGIMATQASAITFLSAPGQAYTDGMRFVQYYFGLPIAMVVICVTFIPIFRRLQVYTAYEYLEQRFDRRTRLLTSLLFLLSRGLSTGISIYAPAIILSSMLGWNIYLTNVIMGGLLIIYTYTGGAKAVAHTQKLQFLIILASMGVAGYMVVHLLPAGVHMADAMYIAGKSGKLNAITTRFDWKDKYNIWSGIFGGFFLALSYFGTDQSQVGRVHYRCKRAGEQDGRSAAQRPREDTHAVYDTADRRAGVCLLQLSAGAPLLQQRRLQRSEAARAGYAGGRGPLQPAAPAIRIASAHHSPAAHSGRPAAGCVAAGIPQYAAADTDVARLGICPGNRAPLQPGQEPQCQLCFSLLRKKCIAKGAGAGLLFAVIILASWGSISAALNSLTASSLMDVHLLSGRQLSDAEELRLGRLHTLCWGVFCICVAMFASRLGSLIGSGERAWLAVCMVPYLVFSLWHST